MSYTNTSKTFFMCEGSTAGVMEKLVDITSFPAIGGAPEMLETTTLSDLMQTFIEGIETNESMSFGANYTKESYQQLKAMKGQAKKLAIWFGGDVASDNTVTPTGDLGKFTFTGQVSVSVSEGNTNEVRKMTITVAPNTAIAFE